MNCEMCESRGRTTTEGVEFESSRTMYHVPETCTSHDDCKACPELGRACQDAKPDPNAPLALCRDCAAEHHEHWDGMWSDYYSGLI
jgi:hypothetical protein